MIAFTQKIIKILAFITTVIISLLYYNHLSIWYALATIAISIFWYRLGTLHNNICQLGFVLMCFLIATDVLQNGLSLWGIVIIHTTLSQWDLATFSIRLHSKEITQDIDATIQHHLKRLGYVVAVGTILSVATFYLQTNIPLLGIIICGVILMIAVSRTVIRLRRDTA